MLVDPPYHCRRFYEPGEWSIVRGWWLWADRTIAEVMREWVMRVWIEMRRSIFRVAPVDQTQTSSDTWRCRAPLRSCPWEEASKYQRIWSRSRRRVQHVFYRYEARLVPEGIPCFLRPSKEQKMFWLGGRKSGKIRYVMQKNVFPFVVSRWGIYVGGLMRAPHHQADQ